METMNNLIPPDYDHPREDDDILEEEVLETDEARIEKILDEQEELKKELLEEEEEEERPMSEIPFSGTPWQPIGKSEEKAPWERNTQTTNTNPWGSSNTPSWGGGWGSTPSTSKPWENNTPSWGETAKPSSESGYVTTPIHKRVVICDLLDCLYETWESNDRPDILPRAIFDLKPKFKSWEKIKSLSPERIYIIFPSGDLVPSFGNQSNAEATLNYVAQSISTYLMLPRQYCQILRPLRLNSPKENILLGAIQNEGSKNDLVYVGVHSGRFGLSDRDLMAARNCGVDYIDLFNLLEGRYNYEQWK